MNEQAPSKRKKRPKQKKNLSPLFISKVNPQAKRVLYWDTKQDGLALSIEPTGTKRFVYIYRFKGDGRYHGKNRWYTFPRGLGLADAREQTKGLVGDVSRGIDVQAVKSAPRQMLTFKDLAARYVEEDAKIRNRSWKQGQYLIRSYVLPKLGTWLVNGGVKLVQWAA